MSFVWIICRELVLFPSIKYVASLVFLFLTFDLKLDMVFGPMAMMRLASVLTPFFVFAQFLPVLVKM